MFFLKILQKDYIFAFRTNRKLSGNPTFCHILRKGFDIHAVVEWQMLSYLSSFAIVLPLHEVVGQLRYGRRMTVYGRQIPSVIFLLS